MSEIQTVRRLTLWIFFLPVIAINLCLFISVNYHLFEGTIFTIACFKDFQVNEDFFLKQMENPRSGSSEFFQDLTEDFFREFIF